MITNSFVESDTALTTFGGLTANGSRPPQQQRQFGFTRYVAAVPVEPLEFADSDVEDEGDVTWKDLSIAVVAALPASNALAENSIEPRLRELQTQFLEDYSKEIRQASVFALRVLLASTRGLRKPILSAAPSGNLIATWRKGDSSLSLRLIGVMEVHFAYGGAAAENEAVAHPYGTAKAATFFAESKEARELAT